MKAIRLRTEYLENPIGIDLTQPRLFWNCLDGMTQTAYQLRCENEAGKLLWDSGKVVTSTMWTRYMGPALRSRSRVLWRVRLWDEADTAGDWSEQAVFEMGLLRSTDWTAQWISGNYKVDPQKRYPVDCFRKVFTCDSIVKARLYATACGVYEARLNGCRVGNFILAPGITDYKKRIQYQTYDVTELVQAGENVLTFQLADGWYRGSVGAWGLKNQYGAETKLLAQLELTAAGGAVTTVATDGTWAWSSDGLIRFADNKDGEIVDARRRPSYTGRAKVTACDVTPTAANNVPVVEHESFTAVRIPTPRGSNVLDFGQNIAGYVEFTITAHAGQKVFLRFGEMLDQNGEFTQDNIQCKNKKIMTPLQQVEYICKEGINHYKTTFAIFGFRYVLVETEAGFDAGDFTAIAVYSDLRQTAWFTSSNELLNRFVDCTLWSTKGNSADLPTDCPTRERHGWTGDAQVFFSTAAYLFDYAAFAGKFLRDVYDWQRKDGCLPQIVPSGGVDSYMNTMNGSVGWADAGILIPYHFWKQHGDEDILRRYYPGMRRYTQFMISRCGKTGLMAKPLGLSKDVARYAVNAGQSYGEWAEPADVFPNKWTNMVAPHPEESTAYTAWMMRLMEEIATQLDEARDIPLYHEYAVGCRRAYQAMAAKPRFTLDTDRQARLVRPLAMDLLDAKQAAYARKRLLTALENYGWRLGTGFLSTPLILDVLADIDIEVAYKLLENEEMPGWLFMPKMGATTVWESWEGTAAQSGIASLNHYSKGAVCQWLFRVMCGVQVSGENHFVIAPRPGGSFTHAGLRYESVYGMIESAWRREGGKTVYTITVPANTTAEIRLPGRAPQTVRAGRHTFEE